MKEGETLVVETFLQRPFPRILIRKWVRSIEERDLPGTVVVLALCGRLRGIDWEVPLRKALVKIRSLLPSGRFPGSDLIIALAGGKILTILRYGPWGRKILKRWSFGVGTHCIDLSRLDIPENRDLLLLLRSCSEESLSGTIDFSLRDDDS